MKIVKSRKPDEIELENILASPDKVSDFFGVIALYHPERRTIYRLHASHEEGKTNLRFAAVVCLGGNAFRTSPTLYRAWSSHSSENLQAVLEPFLEDGFEGALEYFKTEKEFTHYVKTMIEEYVH